MKAKKAKYLMILLIGLGLSSMHTYAESGSQPKGDHQEHAEQGSKIKVSGEVVDMMCYLDHGAKGEGHAACAKRCIKGGGPVGLLTKDDKLYLLIGAHAPANDKLVEHAAKTITVEGKFAERNGVAMIENIHILK